MKTFSERLNAALDAENISQAQLAEAVGLSQPAIQKLTSGKAKSSRKVVEIAKALNVRPEWLSNGLGQMRNEVDSRTNRQEPSSLIDTRLKVGVYEDINADDVGDFVEIPLLDVSLSAGNGAYEVTEYTEYSLVFRRYYLRKLGVSEESAKLVRVTGRSMEPTLHDGDIVGVNTQETAIRDGKTYAICQGDLLRVKILIDHPEHVTIRSINRDEYPDEIMPREAFYRDVRVIGKVFWSSHSW